MKKAQIAYQKVHEAITKIPSKYVDFVEVFSLKLATKLFKYIEFNNLAIKLVNDQQSAYSPIYNLSLVELETLKLYIKNNLANGFIKLSKSLVQVSTFLNKNLDGNLRFSESNK